MLSANPLILDKSVFFFVVVWLMSWIIIICREIKLYLCLLLDSKRCCLFRQKEFEEGSNSSKLLPLQTGNSTSRGDYCVSGRCKYICRWPDRNLGKSRICLDQIRIPVCLGKSRILLGQSEIFLFLEFLQ